MTIINAHLEPKQRWRHHGEATLQLLHWYMDGYHNTRGEIISEYRIKKTTVKTCEL